MAPGSFDYLRLAPIRVRGRDGLTAQRRKAAVRHRRIGFASQSHHTDGQVAQGRHDLGCGAGAYLGPVFIEGNVPYPVHSVLDAPVSPPQGEEPLGTGVGGRQAGNGIGYFSSGFRLRRIAADDAFQSAHLGQMGPVAVAHQQVGSPSALGRPLFDATTVPVNLHRLGRFRFLIPDGRDVLQQGGLVGLYREEVVPPWSATRWHTSRWVNWASPVTTRPS